MKRLFAMLLAASLFSLSVFAEEQPEICEHFRVYAGWNEQTADSLGSEAHRIIVVCPDCGTSVSKDEPHDFSYAPASEIYDGEQHRTLKTCGICGYAAYEYADHEWGDESCLVCGAENPALEHDAPEQSESGETDSQEATVLGETAPPAEQPEEIPHSELPVQPVPMPEPEPEEAPPASAVPEPEATPEKPDLPEPTAAPATPAPPPATVEPETIVPAVDVPEPEEPVLPVHLPMPSPVAAYPVSVISVTVPDNLPLTATGDGYVYAIDNLCISNRSDKAVQVKSIYVEAALSWKLMPYMGGKATGDAGEKAIGICINGAATASYGASETLHLYGDWTIEKGAALPLRYDATVSFADVPFEGTQVLTLYFVLDWA